MFVKKIIPVLILLAILSITACTGEANDQLATNLAAQEQTDNDNRIQQTAEARAEMETEAASGDDDEEVNAENTQAAEQAATQAAEAESAASTEAANAAATQKVEEELAIIYEALEEVGFDSTGGHLQWQQEGAFDLRITGGSVNTRDEAGGNHEYRDFIVHFKITWDTEGWAGCGMIFRSEKDLRNGYQYIFNTLRFSGSPGWQVALERYGDFITATSGGTRYTDEINVDNGSSTTYTLVAEGNILTVYINGKHSSTTTIGSRTEGYFGYYAWQQSGVTTCTFEDVWVWELP